MIPEKGRDSEVVVRFSKLVAQNVAEVNWHKTQRLAWRDDGTLDFHVTVSGLNEISWWILGYGDQAEVDRSRRSFAGWSPSGQNGWRRCMLKSNEVIARRRDLSPQEPIGWDQISCPRGESSNERFQEDQRGTRKTSATSCRVGGSGEIATGAGRMGALLLQWAPLGIHECDTEGRITFVNPAQEAITGYTADELLGTHIWDRMEPGPQKERCLPT